MKVERERLTPPILLSIAISACSIAVWSSHVDAQHHAHYERTSTKTFKQHLDRMSFLFSYLYAVVFVLMRCSTENAFLYLTTAKGKQRAIFLNTHSHIHLSYALNIVWVCFFITLGTNTLSNFRPRSSLSWLSTFLPGQTQETMSSAFVLLSVASFLPPTKVVPTVSWSHQSFSRILFNNTAHDGIWWQRGSNMFVMPLPIACF